MASTYASLDHEFLRPLVQGWIGKIEAASRARSKWKEVADECEMFYSKSAAAMWDSSYGKKFWRNVKAPKFRITINKAFELVAVFGPNLLWDTPTRTVTPKKMLELPEELLNADPNMAPLYQQMMQMAGMDSARDKVISQLLTLWLNYTPRETPGGGLAGQSEMAVIDALIKGRGVLSVEKYQFPGSGRTITRARRVKPEYLLIDPDFDSLDEAKWISIKHIDPHWEVERRFKLKPGSLKNKATLESIWSHGEYQGNEGKGESHRKSGQTNDLVVWYEIFSKCGPGGRLTGIDEGVKQELEETAGDYAYLAICSECPYPLNCPTEFLKGGASHSEVKDRFQWPVPVWADDRWPIECLDFYPDPSNAWPIPPLGPAMGELKLLNFIVPWLCNRTYSSMRDFWAVAGPHVEHYRKYLEEGDDQSIIPTPIGTDDVRKAVAILSGPEAKADVWKIIELVSTMFDKRTGLTEFAYGKNEDGTQNRTAEETIAKARAVGVRPEHMQNKVVAWQSNVSTLEGFLTRWFVTGEDVEPLLGKLGRMLWEQYIMSSDVEAVARQMEFTVAAASMRRPNRDRDIANFQSFSQQFGTTLDKYGETTGNYGPFNGMLENWADFHDADLSKCMIPEKDPNDPQAQMQQQQQQLTLEQLAAEIEATKAEAMLKTSQAQGQTEQLQQEMALKQQEMAANLQMKREEMGMELQAKGAEFQIDMAKSAAEIEMEQKKHAMQMQQDQQSHVMDLIQGNQQFAQQQAQQRVAGQQQLKQTGELGKAKVQTAKAMAKAKPKPKPAGASK